MTQPESSEPRVSRRTLMRTAAWSAPVVVIATASPAYANSADGIIMTNASVSRVSNTLTSITYQFTLTFSGPQQGSHTAVGTLSRPAIAGLPIVGNWTNGSFSYTIPSNGILTFTRTLSGLLSILAPIGDTTVSAQANYTSPKAGSHSMESRTLTLPGT